jgi:hypothetical protein
MNPYLMRQILYMHVCGGVDADKFAHEWNAKSEKGIRVLDEGTFFDSLLNLSVTNLADVSTKALIHTDHD